MLRAVEAAAGSATKATKPRKPKAEKAEKPAAPAPKKARRSTPMRAEVSASGAILRLLAGCRVGLPVSENVEHVEKTCGYRASSLRTTLYNPKKKGAVMHGEDGVYMHPENAG